jgi:hypothetical protein
MWPRSWKNMIELQLKDSKLDCFFHNLERSGSGIAVKLHKINEVLGLHLKGGEKMDYKRVSFGYLGFHIFF